MRLFLGCGLLILLAALQYRLWFGVHGYQEVLTLEAENVRLQEQNQLAVERNQGLQAEIEALVSGDQAIEARARQELGLIKPDETFVRIIPAADHQQ